MEGEVTGQTGAALWSFLVCADNKSTNLSNLFKLSWKEVRFHISAATSENTQLEQKAALVSLEENF